MATCWSKTRPCCKCALNSVSTRRTWDRTSGASCSISKISAAGERRTFCRCYKNLIDAERRRGSRARRARAGGGTAMEMRVFGRTGMQLSVLGFGCGAVGGLTVRGDPLDQERTIARAIATGVNYFDTAVQYGNGESEKNLGRVLQRLKPANVAVGTKVRLPPGDFGGIADAAAKSLEGSLARLDLDRVDIFHLHNAITETGGGEALSVRQVLGDVVPAFERLRQQGKARFLGLTAIGDTAALHQVIDARAFDSAQV